VADFAPNAENLIWIDLEMTGLDTDQDEIIEIATLVTDKQLNILQEGPTHAIHVPLERLQGMDDWNRKQHTKSGLWQRVLDSSVDLSFAQADTLAFLKRHVPERMSPMCGNSICQDRRFLHRQMPELERFFHYRNLDVSTLKELAKRWSPATLAGYNKGSTHLAMADIRDSVAELAHYRGFMGSFSGLV